METAAFETDALLKLLTDALRRGPGTPEWHDAIEHLKREGLADSDEYRLLMTVRERLESGQHYREVRPGPAFTRELFERLADDSAGSGRRPITTVVVALVCLVALVGSLGLLVKYLSGISSVSGGGDLLATQLFVTPLKTWSFTGPIPSDLKRIGSMKLEPWGGVRPARDAEGADAIVLASDLPVTLAGGACVEMQVKFAPGPTSFQLLLGPSPEFNQAGGRSANELAIVCDTSGAYVSGNGLSSDVRSLPAGVHTLRLKVSDQRAIAELNGQQIWSGEHPLGGQAYVGIRIAKTGRPQGSIGVQSLRILVP